MTTTKVVAITLRMKNNGNLDLHQEVMNEGHGLSSKFNKKVEFPHYYMKRQSNKIIGSSGINHA